MVSVQDKYKTITLKELSLSYDLCGKIVVRHRSMKQFKITFQDVFSKRHGGFSNYEKEDI